MANSVQIPKKIRNNQFIDIVFSFIDAQFGQKGIIPPDFLFMYRKQNSIHFIEPGDICKSDTKIDNLKDDEKELIKKILAREASEYCIFTYDGEGFVFYFGDKNSWNYGCLEDINGQPAVVMYDKIYDGKFLEDYLPKFLHFGPIGDMNPSLD